MRPPEPADRAPAPGRRPGPAPLPLPARLAAWDYLWRILLAPSKVEQEAVGKDGADRETDDRKAA